MKETFAQGSGRKRVLVADDDVDVCALLELVLAPVGEVVVVHDAETALVRLAAGPPFDIIVSDYNMPGISGLEFVERVRGGSHSAGVPILMISGHGALSLADRAHAAGVDAFLDKPFTLAQLRSTIGTLLMPHVRYA